MESLPISNPFPGAASFLVGETSSTQDEARRLAKLGLPSGSLVAAEFQSSGRGRFPDRRWQAEAGKNILCSIRLNPPYASAAALPLRIGAALCHATSIQAIRLGIDLREEEPRLKWPNDLLMGGRKAAGILCEAGSEGVFAGIGLNCNQLSFAGELGDSATSLAIEMGVELDRWSFLELFLGVLKAELEEPNWKAGVGELLWMKGEIVTLLVGLPEAGETVEGRLEGIDPDGALLLRPVGGAPGGEIVAFASGELLLPRGSTGPLRGAATARGAS
jgi:BirA family transcriptional regulator, biotin operon repressor / biotin---[acetyl-CoA-carboxylase] ligase